MISNKPILYIPKPGEIKERKKETEKPKLNTMNISKLNNGLFRNGIGNKVSK